MLAIYMMYQLMSYNPNQMEEYVIPLAGNAVMEVYTNNNTIINVELRAN